MPGCVFKKIEDLMHAINHTEYDFDLVKNYRDKYISHQEGTATNLLAEYILDLRSETKARMK